MNPWSKSVPCASSCSIVALFGSLNCTTDVPSSAAATLGITAIAAATATAPIHGFTSHSLRLRPSEPLRTVTDS